MNKRWEDVSTRFRLVFADPETAFRAVDVEAMVKDSAAAKSTLATIGNRPEGFGALKGKTGIFATRADKEDRETATVNAPALARDLARYLEMREAAVQRLKTEERALRHRISIDIPALSPAACAVLERVRDAIDRNDLPAALGHALADREAKQEIDGFNKAVAERFGERTLLSNAAREPSGRLFESLAKGLQLQEREHLKEAWPVMRAAQQLAAQVRTVATLKQAEDMKLSQRQTPVMKQ
ncbi:hypothetical protein EN852_013485 [Mesorhizobium sp. M2E.F.Ca.ET.209.01.1.1]|nr:hypothetical protein EN852_013485 [Mesorhizobium sp. M2E.F.Ca.ET.209.01.1.1]